MKQLCLTRGSFEIYLGLTFDFLGSLVAISWNTPASYLWIMVIRFHEALFCVFVAFLRPRKENKSSLQILSLNLVLATNRLGARPLSSLQSVFSKSSLEYQIYLEEKMCLKGSSCG